VRRNEQTKGPFVLIFSFLDLGYGVILVEGYRVGENISVFGGQIVTKDEN